MLPHQAHPLPGHSPEHPTDRSTGGADPQRIRPGSQVPAEADRPERTTSPDAGRVQEQVADLDDYFSTRNATHAYQPQGFRGMF